MASEGNSLLLRFVRNCEIGFPRQARVGFHKIDACFVYSSYEPPYFLWLTQPLIFFVGLTALLVLPGLRDGDLALLAMVRKTFPPWFLGFVGGAGALTAMVPAAIQLLSAATLFAKNLFRPVLAPGMT